MGETFANLTTSLRICVRIGATIAIAAHAPAAFAYVGPGAGLGILSALFAIVLAVLATIAGLILWPIRKLRQRKSAKDAQQTQSSGEPRNDA